MSLLKPYIRSFALIFLLAGVAVGGSGCTPIGVVVGAGALAGTAALEERGIAQAARDKATELEIGKKLFDYDLEAFRELSVEVIEGRVLLTGITNTQENRLQAVQEAWRNTGVADVINEIRLGETVGIVDTSHDLKIAAELRSTITFDKAIKAINYSIEVVDGTIYLFGIGQSPAEVDRIEAHARNIPRVRRIVRHVLMKDDPKRTQIIAQLEKDRAEREAAEEAAEKAGASEEDNPDTATDTQAAE